LDSYIKTDFERAEAGLCTYTHICVEIDLNKGLLDKMILRQENLNGLRSWIVRIQHSVVEIVNNQDILNKGLQDKMILRQENLDGLWSWIVRIQHPIVEIVNNQDI
jgi:hypothetical protein